MSAAGASLILNLELVFMYFVISILWFGVTYAHLYRKNHRHFIFNADIAKRQRQVARAEWESQLSGFRRLQTLISDLHTALVQNEATFLPESAPGEVVLPSGFRFVFQLDPGPASMPLLSLRIFNALNEFVDIYGDFSFRALPTRRDSMRDVCERYLSQLKARCVRLEELIATAQDEGAEIWGTWDFLYFSVVIQTTIGLGDILPNSTLVRKLIILQTMIGYILLVFVLNFVLSSPR
jgi:hypothetical protein